MDEHATDIRGTATDDLEVQVTTHGDVPQGSTEYAVQKVRALLRRAGKPVISARVRLSTSADPAVERPAQAQADLQVDGRQVRAHVAAPSMREAVDALDARLRGQLEHLVHGWESLRGRRSPPVPIPGQWRRGGVPAQRPAFFPRPVEAREIVRHKTFSLPLSTPDEAALDMDLLDYDFHLFTDLETGQDSVLYLDTPATYRLVQLHPRPGIEPAAAIPLSRSGAAAPRLTVQEAVGRLDITGAAFVFFENAETGRGNVLYHRYDGHYGLITPAE